MKSLHVYFYVQRRHSFDKTNTPIPFEFERLNIGEAMNLTSGKFTAPRNGIYSFSFIGLAYFPASSSNHELSVKLYLNNNYIARGYADELGTGYQHDSLSLESTLNLQAGDQIWLQIDTMEKGTNLFESGGNYQNHFSGWLLQENISQSLINK